MPLKENMDMKMPSQLARRDPPFARDSHGGISHITGKQFQKGGVAFD
jgi:hypothetical protein